MDKTKREERSRRFSKATNRKPHKRSRKNYRHEHRHHRVSSSHNQTRRRTLQESLSHKIESTNKGAQILKRMGYKDGKGLGKRSDGIREPLTIEFKTDRKGFGENKTAPENRKKYERKSSYPKHSTGQRTYTRNPFNERKHSPIRAPTDLRENFNFRPTLERHVTKPSIQLRTDAMEMASAEQLDEIAVKFREQIELLYLRLDAEATQQSNQDNNIIIAKIIIPHMGFISPNIVEFIRTEIIGWIGKYQYHHNATPIFHNMYNGSTIVIICENLYAFSCLQHCVDDINYCGNIGQLTLVRSPVISKTLYCYTIMYNAIIRGADIFLNQVKFHYPELKTDRWIVIDHEVSMVRSKTTFLILIDEPSSLALTYHFDNKLFICMQIVLFVNRGRRFF